MLLAGLSFLLASWINNQKAVFVSNVQQIAPIIRNENPYMGLSDITLQFPKQTSNAVINQTIKRDFPNIKYNDWIVWDTNSYSAADSDAFYNEKGERVFSAIIYKIFYSIIYKIDFSIVCQLFLFFSYPLYLLIRFTVWAIVTLKGTDKN